MTGWARTAGVPPPPLRPQQQAPPPSYPPPALPSPGAPIPMPDFLHLPLSQPVLSSLPPSRIESPALTGYTRSPRKARGLSTAHSYQKEKKLCPECWDAQDTLDISDATCLTWTMLAMALCVTTHCATAPCVRMQRPRQMRLDK